MIRSLRFRLLVSHVPRRRGRPRTARGRALFLRPAIGRIRRSIRPCSPRPAPSPPPPSSTIAKSSSITPPMNCPNSPPRTIPIIFRRGSIPTWSSAPLRSGSADLPAAAGDGSDHLSPTRSCPTAGRDEWSSCRSLPRSNPMPRAIPPTPRVRAFILLTVATDTDRACTQPGEFPLAGCRIVFPGRRCFGRDPVLGGRQGGSPRRASRRGHRSVA